MRRAVTSAGQAQRAGLREQGFRGVAALAMYILHFEIVLWLVMCVA